MKIFAVFLLAAALCAADSLTILIKMMPSQEAFFRERIIAPFEKETGTAVAVRTFQDNWDLEKQLADSTAAIDVVKVPMGVSRQLAEKGLVRPLVDGAGREGMALVEKSYFLPELAMVDGTRYYVPRKFETRIMVYLRSKVEDAVKSWEGHRDAISERLSGTFGTPLPEGYALEDDPDQWDWLDLFVAGFVWAHTEYGGTKKGRVAHRGRQYSGTAIGLIDRCMQMGAGNNDIMNVNSPFFDRVLAWESLFASSGVYPPDMWEQGWSGSDIWEQFGNGSVFLSFLTQIDCYFLHGTDDTENMPGHLADKDDLGFACMPAGLLPDLSTTGKRSISTGGWLWGLGSSGADPAGGMKLVLYITNQKNQLSEGEQFGIIPVRKDILGNSSILFSSEWKTQVFRASLRQLMANKQNTIAHVPDFEALEKKYLRIWTALMKQSPDGFADKETRAALFE